MPEIVLASTSPYRRQQLARLGLSFSCIAPACDEAALKREHCGEPQALAERLAAAKAASIADQHPDDLIIAGDQICSLDGAVLDKPGSHERAREQLQQLSGREHQLITAIHVRLGAEVRSHTDLARISMRTLMVDEIDRYLAADQPLDCAGSYKIESRGITLVDRIVAEDHSAITGLPLIALCRLLRELGVQVG